MDPLVVVVVWWWWWCVCVCVGGGGGGGGGQDWILWCIYVAHALGKVACESDCVASAEAYTRRA